MSDNFTRWREAEEKRLAATYAKFPVALARGEGMRVFDVDGKAYLDFYGGHAVAIIGHCHPHLVASLGRQIGELIFYSNLCHTSYLHPFETFAIQFSCRFSDPQTNTSPSSCISCQFAGPMQGR